MGIFEIIVGAVVLLLAVVMIIVIIFQEGHDSGLGTITGGADSFLGRGKAKTADAMFAKITKYCAIAFFAFVVLLNALSYFGLTGKSSGNDAVAESTVSQVSTAASEGTSEESTEASGEGSAESTEESKEGSAESTEASDESSAESTEASEENTEE